MNTYKLTALASSCSEDVSGLTPFTGCILPRRDGREEKFQHVVGFEYVVLNVVTVLRALPCLSCHGHSNSHKLSACSIISH